jgi:dTDP-4-dehydrorhamnose 3,5-epimerase
MIFTPLPLGGAYLIEPALLSDERGFFASTFHEQKFAAQGLPTHWVGVNNSFSPRRATLRGLHYQVPPRAQAKLIRCVRGALRDMILDLRQGSPTFGRGFSVELTAENRRSLFIPKGFAHGFITLTEATEMLYFIDEIYSLEHERGVRWNDPRFALEWPIAPEVLSPRDRDYPDFSGVGVETVAR